MDKLAKSLEKFSDRERETVASIINALKTNNFLGCDVLKLKGRQDVYRIRKGSLRIIYRKTKSNEIFLLAIERRSEKTYKNI